MTSLINEKPRFATLAAGLVTAALSLSAHANDVKDSIRDRVSTLVPDSEITSIEESKIPGMYEVIVDHSEIVYMSSDARHFIAGDMMRIDTMGVKNLTDDARALNRMQLLSDFGRDGVISYNSENEKIRVAVFSDIDCPYCQKLHDDMDAYLDAGISIDYYAFPRSGPDTPSFRKYESVWCSDDQALTMDVAMSRLPVDMAICDNPVEAQFLLGQQLGVQGTPSIISSDGQLVPGLVPPQVLLEHFGL